MNPRNVLETGFCYSDFGILAEFGVHDDFIAKANALLSHALKDAVRVYVVEENVADGRFIWNASEIRDNRDTHTALLIKVEKIGAKDGE